MEENLKRLITSLTDLTDKLADYTLGTAKKRISALGDDPKGALQVEEDDFEKANITKEEIEKERRLARAMAEEWFNPNSATQKRFSKYKKDDDGRDSGAPNTTPGEEKEEKEEGDESEDKRPRTIKKSVMPVEITGINEKIITSLGKVIGSSIPKTEPTSVEVEKDSGFLGGLGKWLIPLLAGVAGVAALISGLFGEGEQDMKGVSKMLAKLGLGTAGKAVAKLVGKPVLKLGAKVFGWATKFLSPVLKRIPGIGSLISWAFAYDRFKDGDVIGGLIDVASGIATLLPGPGTAIGVGLDILNAWLDYSDTGQEVKANFGNTLAVMTGKMLQFGLKFLKPVLKRIPVVGSIFSFGSAYDRFQKGEYLKGIIDVASGVANFVPGIGTAISIGLDVLNAFIDPPSEEQKKTNQGKGFWGGISEWFGELVQKMYKFILDILPEKILGVSVRGRVAKWMGIDGYPIDDDESKRKAAAAAAQKTEAVQTTKTLQVTGAVKSNQNIKEIVDKAQSAASRAGGHRYAGRTRNFERTLKTAAVVGKGDANALDRYLQRLATRGNNTKEMLKKLADHQGVTYSQMLKSLAKGYDSKESAFEDKWKDSMDNLLNSQAQTMAGLQLGMEKRQAAIWAMEGQFKKDMEINIGGEAVKLQRDTTTPGQLKISDTQQLSQKQMDEIERLQKSKAQGDQWLYETLKRAGVADMAEKQKQAKLAQDITKRQAMSPIVEPIIRGEIDPQPGYKITDRESVPSLEQSEYNKIKEVLADPVGAPQQKLGPRRDLKPTDHVQIEQKQKSLPPSTTPAKPRTEIIEIKPIDYSTWNKPQPPKVEPITSAKRKQQQDQLFEIQTKYSVDQAELKSFEEMVDRIKSSDSPEASDDLKKLDVILNNTFQSLPVGSSPEDVIKKIDQQLEPRAEEALQLSESLPQLDTTSASDNIKQAGDAINKGSKNLLDETASGWPRPSSPHAWDYLRQASDNINEGSKKIHRESVNFKNDHQSAQIEQNNTLSKKIDLVVQELQSHSQIHSSILEALTTAGLLDKQGETIVNNGGNTNIVNNVEHESKAMVFRDRVVHRLNQTSNKYK